MYLMKPYDDSLRCILKNGKKKQDRTGVGTISVIGLCNEYRLDQGYFPIITKRKTWPKSVWAELVWFLSGSTLNQDLEKLGCKFWGKWCDENNQKYLELRKKYNYLPGDFGPIYGHQLRYFGSNYQRIANFRMAEKTAVDNGELNIACHWRGDIDLEQQSGFDQLQYMINELKHNPFSRRILFNLWNPKDIPMMSLPPCHYTYQVIIDGDGKVNGILTQRSCDFPIGVPANIQFYSTLTIMLAQQCGREAASFVHNTVDSHIYLNQIDQVEEYLGRQEVDSPKLYIKPAMGISNYNIESFILEKYNPLDKIDIPVSV